MTRLLQEPTEGTSNPNRKTESTMANSRLTSNLKTESTMKKRLIFLSGLQPSFPSRHPASATTAGDVVDRESLEAFVRAAEARLDSATTLLEFRDALEDFRNDEAWKKGSIYLFIFTTEGVFVFHGDDPSLEGENHIDLEDANGVKILQEGIAAAAEGGGFVEYLWPDPAVAGDEETGSPKVGYAIPYSALGRDFVLGSGFYPGSAGVEAPPGEQPETPRDSVITAAEVVDGETLAGLRRRGQSTNRGDRRGERTADPVYLQSRGRRRLEAREHLPHPHERRRDRPVSRGR